MQPGHVSQFESREDLQQGDMLGLPGALASPGSFRAQSRKEEEIKKLAGGPDVSQVDVEWLPQFAPL